MGVERVSWRGFMRRFRFRSRVVPRKLLIFLLYRKLRKSAKMVYNRLEIKNDIAKERRCDFAMTLSM